MRLQPGPRHPLTISPATSRIVVRAGGQVIADSSAALELREADLPVVHYLPRADVDMNALTRTQHESYCPFKGDASYFTITTLGESGINSVWSYEEPFEAAAAIKDHLAFYVNRVDSVEELPL